MYLGQIVELAPTEQLLAEPQHPYTKVLLDAVPGASSTLAGRPRSPLEAEPPDPHGPPAGCRFHPRCPLGPEVLAERAVCRGEDPAVAAASRRHGAACHFVEPAGPT
jgi:peptide/nickel transport system ATP-binding protein